MTTPGLWPSMFFLERGWLSANNIVFLDADAATLVDTGYCIHAEQTLSLVRSCIGTRPLGRILNTHLHSDHCGGNAALQAAWPEVQTWIAPGQAQHVANWNPEALSYTPTGQACHFTPSMCCSQARRSHWVAALGTSMPRRAMTRIPSSCSSLSGVC